MSFDAMWLLVLCHVTLMQCMFSLVVSCYLLCPAMSLRCHWLWGHIVWFEVLLWRCGDPKYYSVLQSTTPVLLCTTKYYSSTSLYYKVLLQYFSVLQKYYYVLLQVLFCTTKYYSSTTLYYSKYCSILQSATPVLLCTTKVLHSRTTPSTSLYYKLLLQYYSDYSGTTLYYKVLQCTFPSTTLYYKVLLQYYSVLQSTTPVLLRTTKVLQRTTPSTTLYYNVASWLILDTYETSFTMRGATKGSLQLHQKKRLPRKLNLVLDPPHIWNGIYTAPSNKSHPPTSPNTAPATQNESRHWSASKMKRHLQCAEQQESPSNFTKYCTCHAKWISWLICVAFETSFTVRGASKVTFQTHQVLLLPRNSEFEIWARNPSIASAKIKTIRGHSEDNPKIKSSSRTRRFGDLTRPILETILSWKIQHFVLRLSAAPATKSHTPTSPSTAPATQNESHDWSAWHMNVIYNALSNKSHPAPATQNESHHWSASILHLPRKMHSTLLYSFFCLGIYLLVSILSWFLFSLGIYSLLAFFLSWYLFSLGFYSLLASIVSWHSFLASILSKHLFSLGIYSLSFLELRNSEVSHLNFRWYQ